MDALGLDPVNVTVEAVASEHGGLLTGNPVYKPFRYPWAYEAWLMQQQIHWLPEEVPMHDDVKDWQKNISASEKNLLTQIFRFFVQCYDGETEVLTPKGWCRFDSLPEDVRVAQVHDDHTTDFVLPLHRSIDPYVGPMHHWVDGERKINLLVTPNHKMTFRNLHPNCTDSGWQSISADRFVPYQGIKTYRTAEKTTGQETLTPQEQLMIAFQADGSGPSGDGSRMGSPVFHFGFTKQRKIDRLQQIIDELKIPHTRRVDHINKTWFHVQPGFAMDKTFSWIDFDNVSSTWCREFLDELHRWDGHACTDESGKITYSYTNTNKAAADKVCAVAVLAGYGFSFNYGNQPENPLHNPVHKLTWTIHTPAEVDGQALRRNSKMVPFNGAVYCVTVPTGRILVRRHGSVAVCGNSDIEVNNCYHKHYMQVFKPTEVTMMMTAFSNSETIHVVSYAHLLDTVGIPEVEYSAFLKYKEMKDKYDYMQSFRHDSKYEIAKTLAAFGAFTEGLQLFASFAILLNFPRHNKMRGMGQIITYSVRDECYAEGTEILTPRGWVDFANLTDDDKVAQCDSDGFVSFVAPTRRVEYDRDGTMVQFSMDRSPLNFCVTPAHDVVYIDEHYGMKSKKINAQDFIPNSRRLIPISGFKADGKKELTHLERVLIAFAADGTLPDPRHTGSRHGYLRVSMTLKKERKVERIRELLANAELTYSETVTDDDIIFRFNAPVDISKKLSTWIKLEDISAAWGSQFIEELMHWDGHDKYGDQSYIVYGTTVPEDRDLVQAICAISGFACTVSTSIDPRGHKDYYRLHIREKIALRTGLLKKEIIPYKGKVRCVTVPAGAVIVRYKGDVCISGNTLHCLSAIRLFRTFIQENPELWTTALQADIYSVCATIVEHEDAFIDLAFEMGPMEGLAAGEVKEYIRYIADRRLLQLGLEPIYHVNNNPLPWLDTMLNAVEHTNFFENRSTEYSRASTTGTWEDAFADATFITAQPIGAIS